MKGTRDGDPLHYQQQSPPGQLWYGFHPCGKGRVAHIGIAYNTISIEKVAREDDCRKDETTSLDGNACADVSFTTLCS